MRCPQTGRKDVVADHTHEPCGCLDTHLWILTASGGMVCADCAARRCPQQRAGSTPARCTRAEDHGPHHLYTIGGAQ